MSSDGLRRAQGGPNVGARVQPIGAPPPPGAAQQGHDFVAGGVRATFSQEAVQEFQVLASSYSAEFGNAAGGVVNIVTRSGTNTMSGDLFIFFRHDALNAKEHFERFTPAGDRIEQPKAPFRQHQFGGTLGGPLRRNQTFFFVSAERLRVRANNFVNIDDASVEVLQRSGFPVDVGHVPYRYESDQVLSPQRRARSMCEASTRLRSSSTTRSSTASGRSTWAACPASPGP